MNKIIIAIDGYSSCGKSTASRQLAARLGYKYIDTGAMYRAVTLSFLQNNIHTSQEQQIADNLDHLTIDFSFDEKTGMQNTFLNHVNVEEEIREWEVTQKVSEVSAIKAVRTKLVKMQQAFGAEKGIVMDGRDIGTVVFPEAELKVFMTADPVTRAERRYNELLEKGSTLTYREVYNNLRERDRIDTTRDENPLRKAEDAITLDNTDLTHEEQLQLLYDWATEKIKQSETKHISTT